MKISHLFKKNTQMFSVALLHTGCAGVAYYRMITFVPGMMPRADVFYMPYNSRLRGCNTWDYQIGERNGHGEKIFSLFVDLIKMTDVIVIQMLHSPYGIGLLKFMKEAIKNDHLNKKIYMEFDDDFLRVNPEIMASMVYKPSSESAQLAVSQMELSDGLIVSTRNLAEYYSRYNPNVHVIRNGIDFAIWDKLKKPAHDKNKVAVGFVGGLGHSEDLGLVKEACIKLLETRPEVELRFMGCVPEWAFHNPRIKYNLAGFDIDEYPAGLADMKLDIGLAPLRDNEFNRSKSNLRWLEYSALSIPTVASPVRPFSDSIVNGKTGYIARSSEEWYNVLVKLVDDVKLRNKIGKTAYNEVKGNYNAYKIGGEYIEMLKKEVNWK